MAIVTAILVGYFKGKDGSFFHFSDQDVGKDLVSSYFFIQFLRTIENSTLCYIFVK